jgi:DNA-binding transcriptional LysR family regulator
MAADDDITAASPDLDEVPADAAQAYQEDKQLDGVSIGQIRTFLAFIKARSVTGAARESSRDPSTVSRQLAYLDKALPFSLTRKHGKDTIPTNRALTLAGLLRKTVTELESFIAQNSDRALWVRIGAGATSLHSLIVPNLEALRGLFTNSGPDAVRLCRLHLANLRSRETVTRLLDGRLDFGVVRESALETVKGLDSASIRSVSYNIVMARRFADELGVSTLDDIIKKKVPIVTLSGVGEFKRELRTRLEEGTYPLNLTDELDFFADVVMAVRCNHIAGIVPTTALAHEPDEALFLALPLPFFDHDVSKGRTAYQRDFRLVWQPKLAFEKFAPKAPGIDPSSWFQTSLVNPILGIFNGTIEKVAAISGH